MNVGPRVCHCLSLDLEQRHSEPAHFVSLRHASSMLPLFGIWGLTWHRYKSNNLRMVSCYHGNEHYSGMGRKPLPLIIWTYEEGGAQISTSVEKLITDPLILPLGSGNSGHVTTRPPRC